MGKKPRIHQDANGFDIPSEDPKSKTGRFNLF